MTIYSITGAAPTVASAVPSGTLPAGLQTGDKAYLFIHTNGSTTDTELVVPTGWTIVASLGPLSPGNNCLSWLLTRTLTEANSSTTWTGGFARGLRYGWALAVFRYATTAHVGGSDNTLDTTLSMPSYTPGDVGSVYFGGLTTAADAGAISVDPPTGWTEVLDMDTGFVTAGNVAVFVARRTNSVVAVNTATLTKSARANVFIVTSNQIPEQDVVFLMEAGGVLVP